MEPHTTPQKFENGVFTLKPIRCCPYELRLRHLIAQHSRVIRYGFVFDLARKLHRYLGFIVFKKLRFQNIFRQHENENQDVQFLLLEGRFAKNAVFVRDYGER